MVMDYHSICGRNRLVELYDNESDSYERGIDYLLAVGTLYTGSQPPIPGLRVLRPSTGSTISTHFVNTLGKHWYEGGDDEGGGGDEVAETSIAGIGWRRR